MNGYSQTNLQLYGQLIAEGRPEDEVRLVRDAYELAMRIFAGQYRGNGKPFVSHLIGVASILAKHRRPIETITAGLLHSTYSFGEFGDGTRVCSPRKRHEVSDVVGAAAEKLVAQYTVADWRLAALNEFRRQAATLSSDQKEVVAIKIADVIEDHLDQGLDYIPAKQLVGKTSNDALSAAMAALAEEIGLAEMAGELAAQRKQSAQLQIPQFLINSRSSSFLLAPRSHREKTMVRLRRKFKRWRRKKAA